MSYEVLQSSVAEFKKRDQCEVPFNTLIMTHSPCNEIWWCCIFRSVRSETVRTWTLCVTNSPPHSSAPITRETPLYQCVASMRSVFCEFLFKCKEFNIQVKSQEAFLTGFKIIALIFFFKWKLFTTCIWNYNKIRTHNFIFLQFDKTQRNCRIKYSLKIRNLK